MKKLLTFLTLLTLFFTTAWAATFDFTSMWSTTTDINGVTLTESGVSLIFHTGTANSTNNPKGYSDHARLYQGNTLDVSAGSNTISSIEITCTTAAYANTFVTSGKLDTSTSGTFSVSGTVVTLSNVNSSSVTITHNGSVARISSIEVNTSGGTTPTTYNLTDGSSNGSVTFTVGGNTVTSAAAGATVTATATAASGYEFSSWTQPSNVTNWSSNANTATFTMPAEAVTVSATFTEQSTPSTGTLFERVTSLSSSDIGKRFIIVSESAGLALDDSGTNKNNGTSVTISSHSTTVPSNSDVGIFTLGNGTNGYTLAYSANDYMTLDSGSTTGLGHGSTATDLSITFDSNGNAIIANSRRIACYNNTDFRTYASWSSGQEVQLYREVESAAEVTDLYILGQVDGNDLVAWNPQVGPQMSYSNINKVYTADVYCTGLAIDNNNTTSTSGYSYFAFATELNTWDNLNANNAAKRYGSGATGDYWVISKDGENESHFGDAVPLYKGSQKSYRLPAGLYTLTVDLEASPNTVTVAERAVTMTVNNQTSGSTYFEGSSTATLVSNLTDLGGKIYYTTDGTDPTASSTEYTEPISITANTTVKAIAILGAINSDIATRNFYVKPAAPVITPNGGIITEATPVTITCATEGAVIYYTTNGDTPTNESTPYTGEFTINSTTTVKAIAYLGDVYGSVTTATFTYSEPVQPGTGDFTLVTDASQLIAGNEYIILTSDGSYAMGALTTGNNPKGSQVTDFTLTGTTVTAGSTVNVLTLGGTSGAWTLQQSDDTYITLAGNTNISGGSSACALSITISDNVATIYGTQSGNGRLILHQAGSANCFGNYATGNITGANYTTVYLYTRGALQPPVFTPAGGIYGIDVDVTISCPTTGATIYYTDDGTDPKTSSTRKTYTGEILVSTTTTFKAYSVKDDETSSVVTATYTITPNTDVETVTLTYSEPFTEGVGKFIVNNESGFSPVWTLDGNYGVKGTSYSNGTNYAATSRFLSPYVDMTDAVQPALTFSHQINSYFDDVTNQCELYIREVENGTPGTWTKLSLSFSTPSSGGWTNDLANIDLSDYAGKTVQVSFLYTNPTEGTGAGTWEIQNFRMYDASDVIYVNNIAEFLALEDNTTATFRNPVTVLYDYAQNSNSSYQEYIWFKDESGYSQFYLLPTLNSTYDEDTETYTYSTTAKYENGDIIPAGFKVVKNYYAYGAYLQAFSNDALNAGFQTSTQKGLADPEYFDYNTINSLVAADTATYCNRYITLEKIRILSKSGKNFTFSDENSTTACNTVGYNKFSDESSLEKDGSSAVVTVPDASTSTYYNVKAILQVWKGQNNAVTWEILPIEFTEWKAEEVTLRKLCADGVEQTEYTISNNLLGVYASADGTKLWVKDDTGQSIWSSEPDATYKDNFAIEFEESDGIPANTRMEQANYDQSNWCEIHLTSGNAGSFVNQIIKGGSIVGKFTSKLNPTMENVSLSTDDIYSESSYALNYYIPANFLGNQKCNTSQYGQDGHGDYFFMNPKPQEVVEIVWAIWDSENQVFKMSEDPIRNTHQFEGEFSINPEMNIRTDVSITDGYGYNFKAIIRKTASGLRDVNGGNYEVYPLDLDEGIDPATAINSITAGNGEVKSVKYVNVAGMVSDTPFQGVNIVVTEYTDGTRTATKMLKR